MSEPKFSLPEERNWELIFHEDEIKRLVVNEKGEVEYKAPYLWECNKCGDEVQTPDPKPPDFCTGCKKPRRFKPLFPDEIKALYGSRWHIPWQLPDIPKETDSLALYVEIQECLRKHIVFTKPEHYDILALWIMASWKVDSFEYCSYLLFRGEIESGKTRAIDVINQLAYHSIGTVGITPAVLRKQVEWFRCTCAIDQAEDQLNRKFEAGQEMYRIVAAGYKRGMFVARCVEGKPDKITYDDPYGFKAFASTKSFDAAIDSRSIIIDMEEAEPENLDIDKSWCRDLRSKLLYWRLSETDLPHVVDTVLRGRTRELFMSLLAVAEITDAKDKIEKFALEHQKARRMELLDQIKASIVDVITELEPKTEENRVYIQDIKQAFEGRGFEISSSYIGRNLTNLDIPRLSSRKGRYIDLTDSHNIKKLKYWRKKYGLEKEGETKGGEGVKVSEGKKNNLHQTRNSPLLEKQGEKEGE